MVEGRRTASWWMGVDPGCDEVNCKTKIIFNMDDEKKVNEIVSKDPAEKQEPSHSDTKTKTPPKKKAKKVSPIPKSTAPKTKNTGAKLPDKKTPTKKKPSDAGKIRQPPSPNYPRHSITKTLRIPRAILDQNAGRECSEAESAKYVGVGYNGPYQLEISSAIKYGLLDRTGIKKIKPSELSKKILRPHSDTDELNGLREAVLNAPILSDVYKHYRGENLPDQRFFENALLDVFKIPSEKHTEFIDIFLESLTQSKLVEKIGEKYRIIDISSEPSNVLFDTENEIKKMGKTVNISPNDTCFVMMPFAPPLGDYYYKIYEPAIKKAGLNPIRADNEIFGTGKIMDQIWAGINSSKVLIAELTKRNPNVFYELGIAHALKKPVVLVSSNEEDVPFDLKHIRVIYYDMNDPFWGSKLIDKIAENILSAISNPKEAILFS